MQSATRTLLRQSRVFQPRTNGHAITIAIASRPFTSTPTAQKSAAETVKEAAKTVDKAVASKIVDGIEVGQTATQKAKAAIGISGKEAKGKAAELKGEAKGKAAELKGEAKGKAEEVKGKL